MRLIVCVLWLCVLCVSVKIPCHYYKVFTWGILQGKQSTECKECNCDVIGSHSQHCNGTTGECFCKRGHTARKCDKCQDGHFRTSGGPCTECKCSSIGSSSEVCGSNGHCTCRPGYTGRDCSMCHLGYIFNSTCNCCTECGSCSAHLLLSLRHPQTQLKSIRTTSQDYFISKIMRKLKRMKNKSDQMMEELSTKISGLNALDAIVTDTKSILFSNSKRKPSLPRKADRLLLKAVKSSKRLMGVAHGLDDALDKRNKYFLEAYKQYDYAQKLPRKMKGLAVPTTEVRAIDKQIKMMDDDSMKKAIKQNTRYIASLKPLETSLDSTKDYIRTFKLQVQNHEDTVITSRTRARTISANLAETRLEDVDKTQLLLEARSEYADALYLEEKFVSWIGRLWERVELIDITINNTNQAQSVQNITGLMGHIEFLYTSVRTLPTFYTLPTPLNPVSCSRTFKFVSSVYGLLTKGYYDMRDPVGDVRRIQQVIQHINTITDYQNLEQKYFNTDKLTKKIKLFSSKANNKKLPKLNNSLHLCNHRLKDANAALRKQQHTLDKIKLQIKSLVPRGREESPPPPPTEDYELNETILKLNSLKNNLDNLTLKKMKFRSLEADVDRKLNRMNNKIHNVKLKVLTLETIKFARKDWVLYKLGRETKEISFIVRSDKGSGNVLTLKDQSGVEGLMITLDKGSLTVKCYQEEWWDPNSHFDSSLYSTIYIYIAFGEIVVQAHQNNKVFYSQKIPCVLEPKHLILGRKSSVSSGWADQGFSGCITQLYVNKTPRVIRQADKISGELARCEEHNHVEKSADTAACGNGYLSLSTETLLKPRADAPVKFEILINMLLERTDILSLGPLKISGKKGHITAICAKSLKLVIKDVYSAKTPFILTIDLYQNYVTFSTGDGLSPRRLPCIIKLPNSQYILGTDGVSPKGCIKTLT